MIIKRTLLAVSIVLSAIASKTFAACTLTCPPTQSVSVDPNQCGRVVTYAAPTPSGTCGTITCSPPSGSFFPRDSTLVTCTSSAEAGSKCSFIVKVNDSQSPTVTCPSNVTMNVPANSTTAVATFANAIASDNCPSVQRNCFPSSGSTIPVGNNKVSCVAIDSSGNSSTCFFNVNAIPDPTATPTPAPTITPTVTPTTVVVIQSPVCTNGIKALAATLKVTKLGGQAGDEGFTLTARLKVPASVTLSPQTAGAQLLIEDVGSVDPSLYELSKRTISIPPGAVGTGCNPKDGWNDSSYTNKSGAFQSVDCAANSAAGLKNFSVKSKKGTNGLILTAKASKAAVTGVPLGRSVKVTAVFGKDAEQDAGLCSSIVFKASQCHLVSGLLTCAFGKL